MKRNILLLILLMTSVFSALQARDPQRGYRGFYDYNIGYVHWAPITDKVKVPDKTWQMGASTSQGFQFNPNVYLGAGVAVRYDKHLDRLSIPVFAHFRTDQNFEGYTPFAELRAGHDVARDMGMYLSPGLGYRFNWGRRLSLNAAIAVTVQGYRHGKLEVYKPHYILIREGEIRQKAYWEMRVGFDF